MKPYTDTIINESELIREFNQECSSDDLVWHRDHRNREVTVLECSDNWFLQMDNELPKPLEQGKTYYVESMIYHRTICLNKDDNSILKIKIKEV